MYAEHNLEKQIASGQYFWYSSAYTPLFATTTSNSPNFHTIRLNLGKQTYGVQTTKPSKMEILKFYLDMGNAPALSNPLFIRIRIQGISNEGGIQAEDIVGKNQLTAFIITGPQRLDSITNRYYWEFASERFPGVIADINYGEITINFTIWDSVSQVEIPFAQFGGEDFSYVLGLRIY